MTWGPRAVPFRERPARRASDPAYHSGPDAAMPHAHPLHAKVPLRRSRPYWTRSPGTISTYRQSAFFQTPMHKFPVVASGTGGGMGGNWRP